MKILLAGATGAIGRRLLPALGRDNHEVIALTRDPSRAAEFRRSGVQAVVADALDRTELLRATDGVEFDAVIHQLTALTKPPVRHRGMAVTNLLRTDGTRHLLEVAERAGARRFVTQSIVFGYGYIDHGSRSLTEDAPFGRPTGGPTAPHIAAMATNEELVLGSSALEGIALRYGLFYGGDPDPLPDLLRARKVPVTSGPDRPLAWIHLDDAVTATVAALDRGRPGQAYNIVDDVPASWRSVITAAAAAHHAPSPPVLPGFLIKLAAPYVAAMLNASLRVSNDRAAEELGWRPSHPGFTDGIRASVVGS
ncbi:NAD-dependent epimerase/dehydratase family protein [Microlunatus soli]|uniref:Nucleoside-diphosphate-sugar epimerase n=1 Tax=Microlunatus soli TaxID=630515 RepID=A0A1H1M7B1_9ACTN|nr:NAD(P)-dependent oxidoreductase [Microlunatus soli]SDR82683.1 Nucleoside-diphosphate-sugar epimerase [Microlunatus soli]